MSRTARAIVERAADNTIAAAGINKAFGGPDRETLIKTWYPFAARLDKAVRKLEKGVSRLEKGVKRNKALSANISVVNARAMAIDADALSRVETMVREYSEDDIKRRVDAVIARNSVPYPVTRVNGSNHD